MKIHFGKRGLAALLCVLMTAGIFTVCGFGTMAEGTRELALKTWNAAALVQASTAVGTKNSHDYPIFTTYTQTIGRISTDQTGVMIHNARVQHTKDGVLQYYKGMSVTLFVRLIANESVFSGNLCTLDLAYKLNEFPDQYKYSYTVSWDDYDMTPTQVDPIYGYEYKEFTLTADLDGEVFDEAEDNTMEIRAISHLADSPVTIFSLELVDMEDNVLAKYEGEQMSSLPGIAGTYGPVSNDPNNPAGIVSYAGPDDPALAWRNEPPYTLYNADGQKAAGSPGAILVDGLGMALDEGNYSFSFLQSTMYSLGTKKVTYYVMDGGEVLASLAVNKAMVDATVGSDSGTFETRSVPFTIDADHAGHNITFQVVVFNETDYKLRLASLNVIVDADEPAPADAQAVIDSINHLEINDVEGTAAARAAYDALDTLGKAWVGSELAAKLAQYEQAQTDAAAVIDAITSLGDKAELNDTNYTEKTEALEAVEDLYKNLVKTYGQENAGKLVTNAQALTAYREAYNAAEEAAREKVKQAAIDAVEALIDAIGEVTKDNCAEKKAPFEAAEAAMNQLKADYGDAVENEVTNKATLDEVREWFYGIIIGPIVTVTFGDINADEKIDAQDALMALQASVELITLTDDQILAADVNDDGKVDASDALMILQCSVDLIKPEAFPAAIKLVW